MEIFGGTKEKDQVSYRWHPQISLLTSVSPSTPRKFFGENSRSVLVPPRTDLSAVHLTIDVRNVGRPYEFTPFAQVPLPAIAHWIGDRRAHLGVVIPGICDGWIYVADPGWPFGGLRRFSFVDFTNCKLLGRRF